MAGTIWYQVQFLVIGSSRDQASSFLMGLLFCFKSGFFRWKSHCLLSPDSIFENVLIASPKSDLNSLTFLIVTTDLDFRAVKDPQPIGITSFYLGTSRLTTYLLYNYKK